MNFIQSNHINEKKNNKNAHIHVHINKHVYKNKKGEIIAMQKKMKIKKKTHDEMNDVNKNKWKHFENYRKMKSFFLLFNWIGLFH